jgi:hypothetical protein
VSGLDTSKGFTLTPEAVTGVVERQDVLEHLLDEARALASALFEMEDGEHGTRLELTAMLQRKVEAAQSIYTGWLHRQGQAPMRAATERIEGAST